VFDVLFQYACAPAAKQIVMPVEQENATKLKLRSLAMGSRILVNLSLESTQASFA